MGRGGGDLTEVSDLGALLGVRSTPERLAPAHTRLRGDRIEKLRVVQLAKEQPFCLTMSSPVALQAVITYCGSELAFEDRHKMQISAPGGASSLRAAELCPRCVVAAADAPAVPVEWLRGHKFARGASGRSAHLLREDSQVRVAPCGARLSKPVSYPSFAEVESSHICKRCVRVRKRELRAEAERRFYGG